MNWVCDFCSTVNDEKSAKCFVCDRRRSRASLRAAKRKETEKRRAKVVMAWYKAITTIAKYVFWITTISLSVLLTYLLIIKLINREFSSVAGALRMITQNGKENIVVLFSQNFPVICTGMVRRYLLFYELRAKLIMVHIADNISGFADMLRYILTAEFAEKMMDLAVITIPAFLGRIKEKCIHIHSVIEVIVHSFKNILTMLLGN